MRIVTIMLLVICLAGCASRNKTKTTTTVNTSESSSGSLTIQGQESSAEQSTSQDVSECDSTEVEGVYTGVADRSGNYTPARFVQVKNGDTVADFTMTGPGSFKFKNSNSTKKETKSKVAAAEKKVDIRIDAEQASKSNYNSLILDKKVKSTGFTFFHYCLFFLIVIILIGRYYLRKKGFV
ncbi:hypothetical protein ACX0HA_08925 [Flavobacterium hauense]